MNPLHLLGNLAFILIACSLMVKDIFWLRLISVTASTISIIYNFNVTNTPLWVPIGWNLFFISLNIYHVAKIVYGNKLVHLNSKEDELYRLLFKNLTLLEFKKLMSISEWRKIDSNFILVNQGQIMSNLFLIYNGKVSIHVNDKEVNVLKDGHFVGEMSFLSNEKASATVKSIYPTELIVWNQEKLKALISRSPSIVYSLQSAMGLQLSHVLMSKNNS